MQCFVYKSSKKSELYVFLGRRDDFSVLPETLLENVGNLIFVMNLELNSHRKLARVDVLEVMNHIQSKGYFIQWPPISAEFPPEYDNLYMH
jgi:uncharacterized protein